MTTEQEKDIERMFKSHLLKAKQAGMEISAKTICTIILEIARDTKINPQKRLVRIIDFCSRPFSIEEEK